MTDKVYNMVYSIKAKVMDLTGELERLVAVNPSFFDEEEKEAVLAAIEYFDSGTSELEAIAT